MDLREVYGALKKRTDARDQVEASFGRVVTCRNELAAAARGVSPIAAKVAERDVFASADVATTRARALLGLLQQQDARSAALRAELQQALARESRNRIIIGSILVVAGGLVVALLYFWLFR
jgi:hypothetical protein